MKESTNDYSPKLKAISQSRKEFILKLIQGAIPCKLILSLSVAIYNLNNEQESQ